MEEQNTTKSFAELAAEAVGAQGMIDYSEKDRKTCESCKKGCASECRNLAEMIESGLDKPDKPDDLDALLDDFDKQESLEYESVQQSIKSILGKKEKVGRTVPDITSFNNAFENEFKKQLLDFGMNQSKVQNVLLGIRTSLSTNLQPELVKGLENMDNEISEIDDFNGDQSIMKAKVNRFTVSMMDWFDSYDSQKKDSPQAYSNFNGFGASMPNGLFGDPNEFKPEGPEKSATSYINNRKE